MEQKQEQKRRYSEVVAQSGTFSQIQDFLSLLATVTRTKKSTCLPTSTESKTNSTKEGERVKLQRLLTSQQDVVQHFVRLSLQWNRPSNCRARRTNASGRYRGLQTTCPNNYDGLFASTSRTNPHETKSSNRGNRKFILVKKNKSFQHF